MRFIALLGLAAVAAAVPVEKDIVERHWNNKPAVNNWNHTAPSPPVSHDNHGNDNHGNDNHGNDNHGNTNHGNKDHVVSFFKGISTHVTALSHSTQHHKRGAHDVFTTVNNDAAALSKGKGSVSELVQHLVEHLHVTLGFESQAYHSNWTASHGKSKADGLSAVVTKLNIDAAALAKGKGNANTLVQHLYDNLHKTLGAEDFKKLSSAKAGKRSASLVDVSLVEVNVSGLQSLQSLLEQIQSLLATGEVTSEVNSLLGQVESLVSQLGLTKRDLQLEVGADVSVGEIKTVVDSLLSQVNELLSSLDS